MGPILTAPEPTRGSDGGTCNVFSIRCCCPLMWMRMLSAMLPSYLKSSYCSSKPALTMLVAFSCNVCSFSRLFIIALVQSRSPMKPLYIHTLNGKNVNWLQSGSRFLISDIRALWHSALSARVPECQKLKM